MYRKFIYRIVIYSRGDRCPFKIVEVHDLHSAIRKLVISLGTMLSQVLSIGHWYVVGIKEK